MGVDKIYFGKHMKFSPHRGQQLEELRQALIVRAQAPRKQETLDEFFRTQLTERQLGERIEAGLRGYVEAIRQ